VKNPLFLTHILSTDPYIG